MPGLSAFGASRFPKLQYIRLCCIRQCRLTLPHMHANTCRKCLRTCFYFCESSRGEIVAHCGDLFVCFVCVCVYMCLCECVCVYLFMCLCECVCVCTCSCVSVSVCVHVHVPLCVCVYTCSRASVCVHVHVPLCVYMFVCLCACVCAHVETKDQFPVSSSVNHLKKFTFVYFVCMYICGHVCAKA